MDILRLVEEHQHYVYAITFVWTFLEGETFVLFAGLAAKEGALRLDLLILFAWLGSFCGDQLYFFIGRRYGQRLLVRFPRIAPGVNLALGWLEKYSTLFILAYRFIYGVRNFSSVALGMSGVPWRRFLVLNFVAAGVWAVTFAGVGYLFGHALDTVLEESAHGFLLATLVLFVSVVGIKLLIVRRQRRRLAAAPTSAPIGLPAESRTLAE